MPVELATDADRLTLDSSTTSEAARASDGARAVLGDIGPARRQARQGLPSRWMRAFFLWLSGRRWLAWIALRTPIVRRLPYRFIAGTTLGQAVSVVRSLNADGAMATLDVLGESVRDAAAARRAADEYITTIHRIAAEGLNANVSLKLTQMGLDLGSDVCLDSMRRVSRAGQRRGIFVRIDMESHEYVDRTLDIADRLRREGYDVGVVIQSYLRRSEADVERLARERVRVRVCKGAYAEPPDVAFQERDEVDRNFVSLCARLLDADAYPAVATHDPAMIEAVARYARERGIGQDRFEFQMLYGIRRDLQRRLIGQGYRVRIYVPYGVEWYPYFMRRLAERPANVLFVLRTVFGEARSEAGALTGSELLEIANRYEAALRAWSVGERPSTRLRPGASNRLVRRAQKLQKQLRATEQGRVAIERLTADADPLVRLWAATHAMKWNAPTAADVLRQIRDAGREGSADAEIVLAQHQSSGLDLDW